MHTRTTPRTSHRVLARTMKVSGLDRTMVTKAQHPCASAAVLPKSGQPTSDGAYRLGGSYALVAEFGVFLATGAAMPVLVDDLASGIESEKVGERPLMTTVRTKPGTLESIGGGSLFQAARA